MGEGRAAPDSFSGATGSAGPDEPEPAREAGLRASCPFLKKYGTLNKNGKGGGFGWIASRSAPIYGPKRRKRKKAKRQNGACPVRPAGTGEKMAGNLFRRKHPEGLPEKVCHRPDADLAGIAAFGAYLH